MLYQVQDNYFYIMFSQKRLYQIQYKNCYIKFSIKIVLSSAMLDFVEHTDQITKKLGANIVDVLIVNISFF